MLSHYFLFFISFLMAATHNEEDRILPTLDSDSKETTESSFVPGPDARSFHPHIPIKLSTLTFASALYPQLRFDLLQKTWNGKGKIVRKGCNGILLLRDLFVLLYALEVIQHPSAAALWYLSFLFLGSRLRFLFVSVISLCWVGLLGLVEQWKKQEKNKLLSYVSSFTNLEGQRSSWKMLWFEDPAEMKASIENVERMRTPINTQLLEQQTTPFGSSAATSLISQVILQLISSVLQKREGYRNRFMLDSAMGALQRVLPTLAGIGRSVPDVYGHIISLLVCLPLYFQLLFRPSSSTWLLTCCLWFQMLLVCRGVAYLFHVEEESRKKLLQTWKDIHACALELKSKQAACPSLTIESHAKDEDSKAFSSILFEVELREVEECLKQHESNLPSCLQTLILEFYAPTLVYKHWLEIPISQPPHLPPRADTVRVLLFDVNQPRVVSIKMSIYEPWRKQVRSQALKWKDEGKPCDFHFLPC